jgi:hypothetical protein
MRFSKSWLALSALSATVASAQTPAHPRNSAVSVNLLGLPFEYVSAEFESRVAPLASLGLSLSYFSPDEGTYSSVEAKLRLYPNETAPKGFSVGVAGGITHVTDDNSCIAVDFGGADCRSRSTTKPSIAVTADYNWLLGPTKRFFLGAGVGAKRIFGGNDEEFGDINFAYPTLRFQVGIAF